MKRTKNASQLEDSIATSEPSPRRKAPKRDISWATVGVFSTLEDTEKEMLNYGTKWYKKYENPSKESGDSLVYYCGVPKSRDKPCAAILKVHKAPTNTKFELLKTSYAHTCTPRTGLTDEVKNSMRALLHKKPRQVFDEVGRDAELTKVQVTGFMQRERRKLNPAPTFWELSEWCDEHSTVPPTESEDDLHKPFVVAADLDAQEKRIRIFISTKALLATTARGNRIHADGTYKLTWQRLPVLVVGTTCRDHHFALGGVAICNNETEADFAFMFGAMKEYYLKHDIVFRFE